MNDQQVKNLVLFCGRNSPTPIKIVEAIRAEISTHNYPIKISAIIGNADDQTGSDKATIVDYAQSHQILFVRLVEGVANNSIFLDELFRRYQPDWAMSIYCTEIFNKNFLQRFEQVVNYHNGALPKYKGMRATNWAIANGESHAGWTLHRIDQTLDGGNILLQGEVVIEQDDSAKMLEAKLADNVGSKIPEFLQLLLSNDPGQPQVGESTYYSYSQARQAKRLSSPNRMTAQQLLNHIRGFAPVSILLNQGITQIQYARIIADNADSEGDGRHRIISSDGQIIELTELG